MEQFAWQDLDFINREENISLRFQMELHRPYQVLRDANVKSTVSIFGSARISHTNDSNKHFTKWLPMAEQFAYEVTDKLSKPTGYTEYCIATGGGPSVMEYANAGAARAGGKSIGMSIKLPFETKSNRYVDPEFDFMFKYFSLRKFHMMKKAKVIVGFPGGPGTFDELYEAITLQQTGKMPLTPILLYGGDYWNLFRQQLEYFKTNGLCSENDFNQILYLNSVEYGIEYIKQFYGINI